MPCRIWPVVIVSLDWFKHNRDRARLLVYLDANKAGRLNADQFAELRDREAHRSINWHHALTNCACGNAFTCGIT